MRVYFTSDIHGSQKCWLKFLAAPKFYDADTIIMGGDITGKLIVPIISKPNGRVEATFMGRKRRVKNSKELELLKKRIADTGQYWVEMTQDEFENYDENPSELDALFEEIQLERMREWLQLAEERLSGQDVRILVGAGNDDLYALDSVLAESDFVEVPDGQIVVLGDGFEMLTVPNANMTPWDCPRDMEEPELAEKIRGLAEQIERMDRAIFNIHVPPYDTGIDEAPELTEDMQMIMSASGEPRMIPVGSTAVREAILEHQPMLGLHGHIHESSGIRELGDTTLVNPGSEYAEGILRGALIDLDYDEGVTNIKLVAG